MILTETSVGALISRTGFLRGAGGPGAGGRGCGLRGTIVANRGPEVNIQAQVRHSLQIHVCHLQWGRLYESVPAWCEAEEQGEAGGWRPQQGTCGGKTGGRREASQLTAATVACSACPEVCRDLVFALEASTLAGREGSGPCPS